MPYPLNNVAIPDAYAAASEVVFPRAVSAFQVQVFNYGVLFTLYLLPKGLQVGGYQQDTIEHMLPPSLTNFSQTDLPPGMLFAGIKFKNLAAGNVARVTVI